MAVDKRITELPVATTPLGGTEKAEIVQGGVNKQVDVSELGGSSLGTDRTVTGASASIQTDNNALVTFNSATPFNFTLDQLTIDTKISFVNYGAGAVTFINGTGVTLVGSSTLAGSVGTSYPSALVKYDTATSPRIIQGTGADTVFTVQTASVSAGVMNLDMDSRTVRIFNNATTISGNISITISNDSNISWYAVHIKVTGARVFQMPSDHRMQESEEYASRWNSSNQQLTLTGATDSPFTLQAFWDGSVYRLFATARFI